MERVYFNARLITLLICCAAVTAFAQEKKPETTTVPVLVAPATAAAPAPVVDPYALTPEDLKKFNDAFQTVQMAYLDAERAKARHEQAIADYNRVRAEVIGDHGLAPSKHDIAPDGRRIVPKVAKEEK